MRIPAPPLLQHLRSQVNALNDYAIQEFEIGVSEHYSFFSLQISYIHYFAQSFSLSSSATSGCQDRLVGI